VVAAAAAKAPSRDECVRSFAEAELWLKSEAGCFWSPGERHSFAGRGSRGCRTPERHWRRSLHLRGQAGAVAMSAVARRDRTARLTVIDDVRTSPDSEQIKELRIERQLDKRSPSFGPPRVIPAPERANQASRQIGEQSDDRKPRSLGSSPNASSARAPTAQARKPRAVRSRLGRLLPRSGLR
jgi:hypothetical protein